LSDTTSALARGSFPHARDHHFDVTATHLFITQDLLALISQSLSGLPALGCRESVRLGKGSPGVYPKLAAFQAPRDAENGKTTFARSAESRRRATRLTSVHSLQSTRLSVVGAGARCLMGVDDEENSN